MSELIDPPAPARWPTPLIAVHWLSVLLLVVGVGAVLWRTQTEVRAWRALLLDLHRWAGVALFALSCIRLALRLRGPARPGPGGPPSRRLALAGVHGLIYLALFAVPLLGWYLSETRGLPWRLPGVTLPSALDADADRADELEPLHATAAWLLLGLVCAHVAAALWHQFVRRDGLLRVMSWRASTD